jgi:lysozyme
MKLRLVLAALFALALTTGVALAAFGAWTPWTRGSAGRTIAGIDVSRHQGAIDWRALAASDIRFAYIKATEGADHVDPRFAANWRDAAAAGLPRGAYHFFTLCRTGAAQAANFMRVVPAEAGALPPAIDLEHMGPCREGPDVPNTDEEIRAFLDAVEAHYGARPILYVTREFHDAHLRAFRGERFWVRSLFAQPDFRKRDWVIWQHHNRARRPGVSGPVDLNAFRGDEAALARLTGAPRS